MKRLLQIEYLKLKPYRAFWIMWGLYLLILIITGVVLKNIMDQILEENPLAKTFIGDNIFAFPNVWHNISYILSFLHLILCILVIVMVTNEISYKTIRQSTINGLNRAEFLFSKVWMVMVFSLIATLIVFLTSLILGLINGGQEYMFEKMVYIPAFFLQLFGYCSFAIFLSLVVKRAGFAIAGLFIYVFIIEETLAWQLPRITEELTYILPIEVFDKMIKSPFRAALEGENLTMPDPIAMGLSVLYTCGFIGLSYRLLKKRDL